MSPAPPPDLVPTRWVVDDLAGGEPLAQILGHAVDRDGVTVVAEPYHFGSPATGGLARVRGRRPDGAGWSAFVKVLQHVRHWPLLTLLPAGTADHFRRTFPWQEELGLWRPAFRDRLPPGMRVPELLRVVDLGDDRLAVWMEDVVPADVDWDVPRYARAARLLGELGARRCDPEVVDACDLPPDFALAVWAEHGLVGQGLRPLDDDDLWALPALAGHADVRERLRVAAGRVPAVLARFAGLRHGMPHGDASPQNLLVPAADPQSFVAIDISFQTPAPLGFDLSQLVVGLAHAGVVPADRLRAVEEAVLGPFADGVRAAGVEIDDAEVAATYAGTLLVRSGFTAVPYDRVADPEAAAEVAARIGLTRFVLDAADRLLPG